jgi:hypothetical protein
MGGRLELVAALAVNNPGFPLAVVSHGEQQSLVAAGASVMAALGQEPDEAMPAVTARALERMAREDAARRMASFGREQARERIGALG